MSGRRPQRERHPLSPNGTASLAWTKDFQKLESKMTWRIARLPATDGIIQLKPRRSPLWRRYSVIGFEDAPTYLPWAGRTIPAHLERRQNSYTTSVDAPQLASIIARSIFIAAPSYRSHSLPRSSSVSASSAP